MNSGVAHVITSGVSADVLLVYAVLSLVYAAVSLVYAALSY
jgi:hypothetical protein